MRSAAPAARNADATSPRREIGVSTSPQVEPGASAEATTNGQGHGRHARSPGHAGSGVVRPQRPDSAGKTC